MNPFIYGSVVRGTEFYDRKEECARIVKTLQGGNNMVLYAPRRFGKTSLIFQVMARLEKKNFICVYFDFMPVYSLESFVRLYSRALSQKQSNLDKFLNTFAAAVKNIRPLLSVNQKGKMEFSVDFTASVIDETTIAELLDMPEKLGSAGKRVAVFFDEFQEAVKLKAVNFEKLLRSRIQRQKKTNYLFLGSKTHVMNELFNSKNRAFYNSAFQMTIGALPEADTIAYLQKKFSACGIAIDLKTARYLISQAGNIPHYIQLLASEVWQYLIESKAAVSAKIVDHCVDQALLFKSDYYMELFDRQSAGKKRLLQSLTESGKNIFSAAYIAKHRLSSTAAVQRSIAELVQEGIAEKLEGEYFIADPFFRRFVVSTTRCVQP